MSNQLSYPGLNSFTIFFADLALIRLEKTVSFNSEIGFLPICLPTKQISLHGQIAYVERKGDKGKVDCLTDNFGPQKRAKCRYMGNIFTRQESCQVYFWIDGW